MAMFRFPIAENAPRGDAESAGVCSVWSADEGETT